VWDLILGNEKIGLNWREEIPGGRIKKRPGCMQSSGKPGIRCKGKGNIEFSKEKILA
jgi:hypothetical protein